MGVRRPRHRMLVVWLAVLVAVPLACLAAVWFLPSWWQDHGTPVPWHPAYGYYVEFGTTPTLAGIVGWRATHSAWTTGALATASFIAYLAWFAVALGISTWVTGVPLAPHD